MLILISPAKTMKEILVHQPTQVPAFLHKTKSIVEHLKTYDREQLMKLMKINAKIADLTYRNFENICYDQNGYCALECYDGIQFKSMMLETCDDSMWNYMDQNLRILSGLYGILKPRDAIYPYRLEMQSKIEVKSTKHLYAFWMDELANHMKEERKHHLEAYIINLASKEYDKCIRPYIKDNTWIDIEFYEQKEKVLKMHSTQIKRARGKMVRFLAQYHIEHLQDIKGFQEDGYVFSQEHSKDTKFVFIKEM